jgi:sulfite reductase (ferredoxin)
LGGQWQENAGAYGLAIGAVPSRRIPGSGAALTGRYVTERERGESFRGYIQRMGKVGVKKLLDEFTPIPAHVDDPSFYSDWGDPRQFTTGDMGVGECAGEVVSRVDFDLAAAERQVFEGLRAARPGRLPARRRHGATPPWSRPAWALVKTELPDLPLNPDRVVQEFKTRFYDTPNFLGPVRGRQVWPLPARAHEKAGMSYGQEEARQAHRRGAAGGGSRL